VLSTAIPVIYAFTGGMRASIMTDASQARRTLPYPKFASPCRFVLLIKACVSNPACVPVGYAFFAPACGAKAF